MRLIVRACVAQLRSFWLPVGSFTSYDAVMPWGELLWPHVLFRRIIGNSYFDVDCAQTCRDILVHRRSFFACVFVWNVFCETGLNLVHMVGMFYRSKMFFRAPVKRI